MLAMSEPTFPDKPAPTVPAGFAPRLPYMPNNHACSQVRAAQALRDAQLPTARARLHANEQEHMQAREALSRANAAVAEANRELDMCQAAIQVRLTMRPGASCLQGYCVLGNLRAGARPMG